MTEDFRHWAQPRLAVIEPLLAASFHEVEPETFRAACLYPILTGGKRVRPLLCLAAAEALGAPGAWRLPGVLGAAMAVELLHTYSLVHDDLPAMDDDNQRRGRPTVHKVYGDATAILVGDALLTEAFLQIADAPNCVRELARAAGAGGMVGGQYLDIHSLATDIGGLQVLHAKKTGALIRAAVRMGALSVGASTDALERMGQYGELVGLAFQVHDDVLDADQDVGESGPPSYVRLLGLGGAADEARRMASAAEAIAQSFPHPDGLSRLAMFAVQRGF